MMSLVPLDPWLCSTLIESARACAEARSSLNPDSDREQMIETMSMLADQLGAALREVALLNGTMDAKIARLTATGSLVEASNASLLRDEARELLEKRMIEWGSP